jgi:hypothetical protein
VLTQRGEAALIAHLETLTPLAPAGEDFMRALYRLAQQVTSGVIVELGAYVGRSAIALAWDAPAPVYSIDDYTDHMDWSGRAYGAENEAQYRSNIAGAGVETTLIKRDVREAGREWREPIGLLVWDVSEHNRLFDDWITWRKYIVMDGRALLRDTFDQRLGSGQIITHEFEQKEFTIESLTPGLLTLRRYRYA